MYRGIALVNWRRGLLMYVELDHNAVEEFRKIVEICGGGSVCMSSLAARLRVKSLLYITDIYGISNKIAFSRHVSRSVLLEKIWSFLSDVLCSSVPIECGEDVKLRCCTQCGDACLLAKVLNPDEAEAKVDLRREIRALLTES